MNNYRKFTTNSQDNDFVKNLADNISMNASWVLDWIVQNFEPEEVYPVEKLEDWAADNGFTKER